MNVNEVQRIKQLVEKAEIESAKSQGQQDAIKKEWKKTYGTDDINEIEKIKNDLEKELRKTEERKEVLHNKLMESYDWESLEEELV